MHLLNMYNYDTCESYMPRGVLYRIETLFINFTITDLNQIVECAFKIIIL